MEDHNFMRKIGIRILSALVAIMTLTAAFVSCSDNEKNEESESLTSTEKVTGDVIDKEEDKYDSNGFIKDELPDNLSTDLKEVSILYWSDAENREYEIDSLSNGDGINNALYYRNAAVSTRMGVELAFEGVGGNYNNCEKFITSLTTAVNAGKAYDIVSAYSMVMSVCARDGLLVDMSDTYIDLEKPWWPSSLTESCRIGDALYFNSGDASINTLYMMYCCYFNATMLDQYHSDVDIYELVRQGDWTYEKMVELMKDVVSNSTRDPKTDTFGMIGASLYSSTLLEGFGFSEIDVVDGELTVSADYESSIVEQMITEIQNMFNSDYAVMGATADVRDGFNTGRSLFAILYADQAAKRFSKNTQLTYGVVPMPKLEKTQESYITPVANPSSFYGISSSSKDPMFVSAVLECWASESYRRVSPELFEKSFKLKYSEGSDNAQMYDYIRDGMRFNTARLYTLASGKQIKPFTLVPTVDGTTVNWLTYTASVKGPMELALRELNVAFKNIQ